MKKVYLKTPEEVIKALKEGKEIRDDNDCVYKIIDGFIVSEREGEGEGGKHGYLVGDWICMEYNPYIIEKEPLKIKVGEWYETRDHRKARCHSVSSRHYSFTIDNCTRFTTNKSGHYMEEEAHVLDIIGPWKEEK